MGAVFFLTLTPVILAILGTIIIMALVGIVVVVIGAGGSIISAATITNKKIKTISLYFFLSLFLLGLSCLGVLGGLFAEVYFFIIPMLIIIGAAVVVAGIVGIIKAMGIDRMVAKVILIILLSLSTIVGAIVLAIGALALTVG